MIALYRKSGRIPLKKQIKNIGLPGNSFYGRTEFPFPQE